MRKLLLTTLLGIAVGIGAAQAAEIVIRPGRRLAYTNAAPSDRARGTYGLEAITVMKATHTSGHQAAGTYYPASTRYGSLPDTSADTADMCSSKVDGDSSKVQNVLLPDPSGALVAAPGHLRQKRGFQVRPGNLAVPRRRGSIASAGIGVWAGSGGVGNSFNGLSIANNDVNTAFIGISIVGGNGFPGQTLSLPTTNNEIG